MQIRFHKNFEKRFRKFSEKIKGKICTALEKFSKNPFDPLLKNHPLSGKLQGKRAFSASGDLRIIFEEYENYVLVIMLNIGSHNQVYEN